MATSGCGAVALLDEARKLRERSARARELAGQLINDADVIAGLTRFAAELEQRAAELEAQALELQGTIARSRRLTGEIEGELREARKRLDEMGRRLGKKRPGAT